MAEFAAPMSSEERATLDESISALTDQLGTCSPISNDGRAARRTRLAGLLAARDLDAPVVTAGGKLHWLTPASEADRIDHSGRCQAGPEAPHLA